MVPLTLGTATTATITAARENRAFSFRVTAGQRFPVEATASGLRSRGGATPEVNVRAVDPVTGFQGDGPFTVDAPPDPWQYEAAGTGTARIIVDPVGDTTATATFTVSALTDVTASLVLGRATTAVATLPGQNVVFSVPAIGGSTPPAFRVSGVSMTAPLSSGPAAAQVQLRRSGGSFESLADLSPTTTALIHNPQGSYDPAQSGQLVITPSENTTVALTVTMVRSKVTTVAVTPGRPTKVTFANPGDCTVLTFAATGGKWVAVVESQLTVQPVQTELTRATGGPYFHMGTISPNYDEFGPALDAGPAAVTVSAPGVSSGSLVVTLYLVADPVQAVTADRDVRVEWSPGERTVLTFGCEGGSARDPGRHRDLQDRLDDDLPLPESG